MKNSDREISVFLMDPRPVNCLAISNLLGRSPFKLCGVSTKAELAIENAAVTNPDVIITDIIFEKAGGIDWVRQVRKALPKAKIIVFSDLPEWIYALRCVRAGANGYLEQGESIETLLRKISLVARSDHIALSDKMANSTMYSLISSYHPEPSAITDLSDKEIEVLRLVSEGYSVAEISDNMRITHANVRRIKSALCRKLEATSHDDLVGAGIQTFFPT